MSHDTFLNACMKMFHQQAFYNTYWKTFKIVRAETESQKEQAYRLRHAIYCEENHFVRAEDCPERLERDEFDDRAAHFLLIHRETDDVVGTLRVILPQDSAPLTSFELQKQCDHPLLQIENRVMGLAEISRFCMTKKFRRRPRDGNLLPAYYEQEWNDGDNKTATLPFFRRRIPYAPLGLLMAAFEYIMANSITNCITTMESSQFYTLQRMGLCYRVLGPRLEHHGTQQPLVFDIKAVMDNMLKMNPECWDVLTDKGRLHKRADELYQFNWQDNIFDEACREMILRKLT